jgi:photoactive yellow protein
MVMTAQSSHNQLPYGLLELDGTGCVRRYAPAFEQNPQVKVDDVMGHNFFQELMPSPAIKECHDRFLRFMEEDQSVDKFSTTFPSDQGPVKVQILLAQILEKTGGDVERLALVRITPEEGFA